MTISMADWKFILTLFIASFVLFTAGAIYEWSRKNGHSDNLAELKRTRKELEQAREMLYNLTNHAAFNPVARQTARRLQAVKK